MITPMVRTAAGQLVAATETALAQHEADSANEALEAIQRCAATKKAIHQRNMRDALNRIIQAPDDYNCTFGGISAAAKLSVPWRPRCCGAARRAQR